MADYPALPLWTDAFLGDTLHLSAEEVGCYLLLLMVAWRSPDNALPDNDEDLARYCRVSLRRWKTKIRPRLEPFFSVTIAQTWRQKRLDAERNFVVQKRKQQSEAGTASALKRKETASTDDGVPLQRSVQRKGNENSTPTPIPIPKRKEVEEMAQIWNGLCGAAGLAEVVKLHDTRRKQLGKRLVEDFDNDMEQWRAYCQRIAASEFLTGRAPPGPDRDKPFKADIDWVLKPANLAKIVEGKYSVEPAANGSGEPYMNEFEEDLRTDYRRLMRWQADGEWMEHWGPKPGQPGCQIAAEVMAKYGPGT